MATGIDTIVVLQNGEIRGEWYANGSGPHVPRNVKSISKAILSAAVGIAVQKGIVNLDDAIDQVEGCPVPNRFRPMSLRNLLNMASGFDLSDEDISVYLRGNWSCNILARAAETAPGTQFRYSTAQYYLIGAHLEEKLKEPIEVFIQREMLDPMRITLDGWKMRRNGLPLAGSEMAFSPYDLLAFGQHYLAIDGRVVPQHLARAARSSVFTENTFSFDGYAVGWFQNELAGVATFTASGFGGQRITVITEKSTVIVMSSRTLPLDGAIHDQREAMNRAGVSKLIPLL